MKKILIITLTLLMVFSLCSVSVLAVTEGEVQSQVAAQGKEKVTGNIFVWFLCAIAFLKVSQKIDSFMSSLGINVGHTGGSMLGELMIAFRGIQAASGGAFGHSKGGGGSSSGSGFFAIAMVRTQRGSEEIAAFRGLGKTNPRTAFLITVSFASLAGVPLTLGFIVKLKTFVTAVSAIQNWDNFCWLLVIMVLTAATGFYYYFKVLRSMYWEKPQPGVPALRVPLCTAIVLTLSATALIILGTLPLLMRF